MSIITTLVILFGIFALFAEKECVKLPNGIIISNDAYFNLSAQGFRSNVVVKGPDGGVLSRGNDDLFYFSETTAWWVDIQPGHTLDRREGLAYRPDVGLVSHRDNPQIYDQLISAAGQLLEEGKTIKNSNVLHVLGALKSHSRYASRDCGVPLFTKIPAYL
ncbi:MAG: hypothetical protein ACON4J_00085 [Parvibaculales bacterium]